nr:cell envelope biogenesis protein TolA [uncultured Sphingosinicella sp.]
MDRGEATGFGVALAGHAALLAVLSIGFATVRQPPIMADPMEVSIVDEVALTSAVPQPAVEPPAPTIAPELGPPEEPAPAPVIEPAPAPPLPAPPAPPQPKAIATPQPKPAPMPKPVPVKAAPPKPASPKPAPAKPAPAKPMAKAATAPPKAAPAKPQPAKAATGSGKAEKPRGSMLGKDFLKGLGSDPAPAKAQQPTGAVMSPIAMSGIVAAIKRQVQPCADRQVNPGPGASRIQVKINLKLNRDGSLAGRPAVVSTSGVTDENSRYEKRVADLAIAAFTGCSPLRGLPDELYQTAKGGWSNFNMNYKLPD